MNEPNIEYIRKILQSEEVQERVAKSMLEARSNATVTISRAAGLFGFSESQLREWEKRGLLKTERPALSEDSKTSKGHRQFSPDELDKLALIRELMDQGYSVSEIPPNIDVIWEQLYADHLGRISSNDGYQIRFVPKLEHVPVDRRVDVAEEEYFWRFFVSQALRLTLLLICEEMPGIIAGIFLPLGHKESESPILYPGDISKVGPSMVGWLGANQVFYAFFESDPAFTYPTDFRIEDLRGWNKNNCPAPIIVIQRDSRTPAVTEIQVSTIQRIIAFIYKHSHNWLPFFGSGKRDWIEHVTNFGLNPIVTDSLLDRMMNLIVELGGEEPGSRRWKFCNLFLPQDQSLPMQQRTIRVRAHSFHSPAQLSSMVLTANEPDFIYRAYQNGQVIYRPKIASQDLISAYRELEETTRSSISIPLLGEEGLPTAVLYIASEEIKAFSVTDERVLRLIARMIEELLSTYQAYQQYRGRLADVITNPRLVDISFRDFLSENDFIDDLEAILTEIHWRDITSNEARETVSFVAIEIDNQSSLAAKYGDRAARNLSREMGIRIQGQLRLYANPEFHRLYHILADRYYLIQVGVSLEEARTRAEMLRRVLSGGFLLDARRTALGRPIIRETLLEIPDVTVHLGVSSYNYWKLKEILLRFSTEKTVDSVRALIMQNLDISLEIGKNDGGNVIISWDNEIWGYRRFDGYE